MLFSKLLHLCFIPLNFAWLEDVSQNISHEDRDMLEGASEVGKRHNRMSYEKTFTYSSNISAFSDNYWDFIVAEAAIDAYNCIGRSNCYKCLKQIDFETFKEQTLNLTTNATCDSYLGAFDEALPTNCSAFEYNLSDALSFIVEYITDLKCFETAWQSCSRLEDVCYTDDHCFNCVLNADYDSILGNMDDYVTMIYYYGCCGPLLDFYDDVSFNHY